MPYHNDPEAIQWLHDYWDYIQTIERYPATFDEVGGWDGLAQAFTDSQIHQQVLDYLAFDEDNGLTDRLNMLYSKYGNVKKMKKNRTQLAKSGDWIQDWVNGKVEMDSFEANGVSFSLDMSSGGGAYSNDDELIYEGKEILVYMGLPFDTDFESDEDEIIYISAYDENQMELWTLPYSIYQVPTFYHAIGKLEDILRNNNIEAKTTKSVKKSQDIQEFMQNLSENIESVVRGYANGDSDIINVNSSSANNKVDIEVIYQPFDCLSRNEDVKSFVYQVHISGNPAFLRLKETYFIQGELYYRIPDTIKFEQDIFREVSDKEFTIHGKYDYPEGYGIYEGFDAEVGKMLSSIDMALRDCSRRYNMLKELARESLIDYYGDYYTASTKKSQDIHSMIADIRNNNNSLKKNRVRL